MPLRLALSKINKKICDGLQARYEATNSAVLTAKIEQLKAYFSGKLKTFSIPIELVGSNFQKQAWQALLKISYGQTISYLQLSRLVKNERAIRAIASVNGANAIAIIISCHRVIGGDGKLVGYSGGLPVKKKLLQLESTQQQQLNFF